jgi:hypothetical protein
VTAGIGAMHTRLDDPRFGGSFTSTNLGVNAGGGVMTFFGRHLGVRADLRYMKSLGNSSGIDDVHFWRTSLGVTLR